MPKSILVCVIITYVLALSVLIYSILEKRGNPYEHNIQTVTIDDVKNIQDVCDSKRNAFFLYRDNIEKALDNLIEELVFRTFTYKGNNLKSTASELSQYEGLSELIDISTITYPASKDLNADDFANKVQNTIQIVENRKSSNYLTVSHSGTFEATVKSLYDDENIQKIHVLYTIQENMVVTLNFPEIFALTNNLRYFNEIHIPQHIMNIIEPNIGETFAINASPQTAQYIRLVDDKTLPANVFYCEWVSYGLKVIPWAPLTYLRIKTDDFITVAESYGEAYNYAVRTLDDVVVEVDLLNGKIYSFSTSYIKLSRRNSAPVVAAENMYLIRPNEVEEYEQLNIPTQTSILVRTFDDAATPALQLYFPLLWIQHIDRFEVAGQERLFQIQDDKYGKLSLTHDELHTGVTVVMHTFNISNYWVCNLETAKYFENLILSKLSADDAVRFVHNSESNTVIESNAIYGYLPSNIYDRITYKLFFETIEIEKTYDLRIFEATNTGEYVERLSMVDQHIYNDEHKYIDFGVPVNNADPSAYVKPWKLELSKNNQTFVWYMYYALVVDQYIDSMNMSLPENYRIRATGNTNNTITLHYTKIVYNQQNPYLIYIPESVNDLLLPFHIEFLNSYDAQNANMKLLFWDFNIQEYIVDTSTTEVTGNQVSINMNIEKFRSSTELWKIQFELYGEEYAIALRYRPPYTLKMSSVPSQFIFKSTGTSFVPALNENTFTLYEIQAVYDANGNLPTSMYIDLLFQNASDRDNANVRLLSGTSVLYDTNSYPQFSDSSNFYIDMDIGLFVNLFELFMQTSKSEPWVLEYMLFNEVLRTGIYFGISNENYIRYYLDISSSWSLTETALATYEIELKNNFNNSTYESNFDLLIGFKSTSEATQAMGNIHWKNYNNLTGTYEVAQHTVMFEKESPALLLTTIPVPIEPMFLCDSSSENPSQLGFLVNDNQIDLNFYMKPFTMKVPQEAYEFSSPQISEEVELTTSAEAYVIKKLDLGVNFYIEFYLKIPGTQVKIYNENMVEIVNNVPTTPLNTNVYHFNFMQPYHLQDGDPETTVSDMFFGDTTANYDKRWTIELVNDWEGKSTYSLYAERIPPIHVNGPYIEDGPDYDVWNHTYPEEGTFSSRAFTLRMDGNPNPLKQVAARIDNFMGEWITILESVLLREYDANTQTFVSLPITLVNKEGDVDTVIRTDPGAVNTIVRENNFIRWYLDPDDSTAFTNTTQLKPWEIRFSVGDPLNPVRVYSLYLFNKGIFSEVDYWTIVDVDPMDSVDTGFIKEEGGRFDYSFALDSLLRLTFKFPEGTLEDPIDPHFNTDFFEFEKLSSTLIQYRLQEGKNLLDFVNYLDIADPFGTGLSFGFNGQGIYVAFTFIDPMPEPLYTMGFELVDLDVGNTVTRTTLQMDDTITLNVVNEESLSFAVEGPSVNYLNTLVNDNVPDDDWVATKSSETKTRYTYVGGSTIAEYVNSLSNTLSFSMDYTPNSFFWFHVQLVPEFPPEPFPQIGESLAYTGTITKTDMVSQPYKLYLSGQNYFLPNKFSYVEDITPRQDHKKIVFLLSGNVQLKLSISFTGLSSQPLKLGAYFHTKNIQYSDTDHDVSQATTVFTQDCFSDGSTNQTIEIITEPVQVNVGDFAWFATEGSMNYSITAVSASVHYKTSNLLKFENWTSNGGYGVDASKNRTLPITYNPAHLGVQNDNQQNYTLSHWLFGIPRYSPSNTTVLADHSVEILLFGNAPKQTFTQEITVHEGFSEIRLSFRFVVPIGTVSIETEVFVNNNSVDQKSYTRTYSDGNIQNNNAMYNYKTRTYEPPTLSSSNTLTHVGPYNTSAWELIENQITLSGYNTDIERKIKVQFKGSGTQNWTGFYGPTIADISLEFIP